MWNFVKKPDHLWAISLLAWFVAWVTLPAGRSCAAIGMALHAPVLIFGIVSLRANFFCAAICRCKGERRRFALTFDDGPDPALTPAVLDLLDEFGFKATFFLIGRRVEQHPAIARETARRGHTIGCHDLDHRWSANFRRHRRMSADIGEACSIIEQITGRRPRLYRPPVGLSNPHLRTAIAELGMLCIGWNRALRDGGNRFAGKFSKMPQLARAGSIVMLHDCLPHPENRDSFLKYLRLLCETARREGLESVGVDTLLEIGG